ncbi:NAD-dependent epimerase/dehydratase family protein [Sciscionella sediminilitoris]|uniref:NAD-dependent epimerase/dehydratase family protein n=1 Tax=Sciscionella sediminilitoris TaxID=1445613 RepID=UPI0004DF87E3|nr:NAD-dependent epimerase/dehydratase family protein [Sciscionella sp. SE31]
MPSTVLVTGASGYLGSHLAAQLAAQPEIGRVIGVDTALSTAQLRARLGGAEYLRADVRTPLIAKVLLEAKVDTVVHASLTAHPPGPSGRPLHKEMNVIGTMQLLAACQRAPLVRKLVIKSTAAVYGSGPRNHAVYSEEMPADVTLPRSGYAQDNAEVEAYLRGFSRRRPEVDVTTLRFANLIGPGVDTVLTRYFALPVVPTVFGYDGRLQLLHAEDALAVLRRAVLTDLPGTFNVAGDGVLTLAQAIQRAGRVALPVPEQVIGPASRFVRGAKLVDFGPEQLRYLNFGRVVDTAKLRTEFGYRPKFTTREAFDDYVRGRRLGRLLDPDKLVSAPLRAIGLALPART